MAAKMGIETWYANIDVSILNNADIAFMQTTGFDLRLITFCVIC